MTVTPGTPVGTGPQGDPYGLHRGEPPRPVPNVVLAADTMRDPYALGPREPEKRIDRVIPPKGAKVGIIVKSGLVSQHFGYGAVARIVDHADDTYLYLTGPDGKGSFPLRLDEPWEIRPADECTFFNPCSCGGLGGSADSVLGCLDCGGWGVKLYNPFKRKRKRRRRAHANPSATV